MISIPKDRITLNSWIRYYYQLNPVVRNVITMHSLLSIPNFLIGSFDKLTNQNNCVDKLNDLEIALFKENTIGTVKFTPGQKLYDFSKEYWLMGEVFPVIGEQISFLNPDAIFVKRNGKEKIQLRPDPLLRKMVFSNLEADVKATKKLPRKLVESIKNNNTVPIDGFVSQVVRVNSPYDVRGTSLIHPILKALVAYDNILENDPKNVESLKFYKNEILEGLLFKNDKIDLILLEYFNFKCYLSRWIKNLLIQIGVQDDVNIFWDEIDIDQIKTTIGDLNG